MTLQATPEFFPLDARAKDANRARRKWLVASDRNRAVAARWLAGAAIEDIAIDFELSPSRVQQIGRRYGLVRFQRVDVPPKRTVSAPDFWANVRRGAEDDCWPWQGPMDRGYGRWRHHPAHRYSLELAVGRELSTDEWACHTCDNPPCVNPAHLYVGNAVSNARDTRARHPKYRRTASD